MQLYFYDEKFKTAIENYSLSEEQLRFTGKPSDSINLCKDDPDRYSIIGMQGNQIVTYFVLHKNAGVMPYTDNENAILLRTFSTDFNYQGRGYAKETLKILPELVKANFPHMNEIILAVNVRNDVAQRLYKKCGFIDEGIRKMGKKGELIIMSYYL